ncbi:uncharacterized protein LOC113141450 isoform X2 [Mastacembelus armatus]|uniref:uncharacterized protein LOC113141450 isoform X2 n=1 Tax=Mastacembelus armatus TaxID=205130 RepID=UPI000E460C84|nr:uncharacterized protein LOC113141450 isoform X2 [Mastacembelus armatus]
MSAVWTKLLAILCLFCKALSTRERTGETWVDVGGTVTVQCRTSLDRVEYLNLKRGLNEEDVFFLEDRSSKTVIANDFNNRLQSNGKFPNVDILIKNLTSTDTGPYWCVYNMFDEIKTISKKEKGNGSILLIVRDASQVCNPSKDNLVLVLVMISAALLVSIIVGILIGFIFKSVLTKWRQSKSSRRRTHSSLPRREVPTVPQVAEETHLVANPASSWVETT